MLISKAMKKFLLYIFIFFGIVAVVDYGFGLSCEWLQANAKSGVERGIYQFAKVQTSDIIVMGSSRAHHSYVPRVINEITGMSAYNGGVDGNGIVLSNGLRYLIYERYEPEIILYDITPGFDYTTNEMDENNVRYCGYLRPYFFNKKIREVLCCVDNRERYKNFSAMFRYNSCIIELLKDQFVFDSHIKDGYEPLGSVINNERLENGNTGKSNMLMGDDSPIDQLKMNTIENFISDVRDSDTRLVFIASPRLGAVSSELFNPIKEVCSRYNIEFWDYYCDSAFQNPEYYADQVHLNDKGANAFSRCIAHRLID